jgi:hypothetical protein
MINLVVEVVPEAAKLGWSWGSCIRGTGYNIYGIIFNFTIRDRFTWVGIPLYFIETLIRVVPVIAVLATVNEPETGLFVMVLYSY